VTDLIADVDLVFLLPGMLILTADSRYGRPAADGRTQMEDVAVCDVAVKRLPTGWQAATIAPR